MTMATEPRTTSRWLYVSIVLIVLVIVQAGLFSFLMNAYQRDLNELQVDLARFEDSIAGLRSDLDQLRGTDMIPRAPGLTLGQIYELSKDSVVLITAKSWTFAGLAPVSSGSGFLYDTQGHIITNHHVIEDAAALEVTFSDGTIVPAELVGADPYSDLAIIRVNDPPDLLHPLPLGKSSPLQVGEYIIAIGNPFGLSNSVTFGIVSQLGRELDAPGGFKIVDIIQVDAAINPGNSGGPLMNMRGEVVGVNTAIIANSEGVGFAIPADTVTREVSQLIETGTYQHPWIGVSAANLDPVIAAELGLEITKGTIIVAVVEGGPAEAAGLKGGQTGDVIVGVDNVTVRKLIDVLVYIERNKNPGDIVTLQIIREGRELSVPVTLGVRPGP
ncbi:MAG TPA: PDZ domain-containing protein [Methanomicrobia archaeon]|nr:PDZ domain-containing protein [Methanomicrobia archaeon]